MMKIKLVDGTVKTVLADVSLPLIEVVDFIGEKMSLKNPAEFSIQEEAKGKSILIRTNTELTIELRSMVEECSSNCRTSQDS